MILLLGSESNPLLAIAQQCAEKRGISVLWLSSRHLVHHLAVQDEISGTGAVNIQWNLGESIFSSSEITGVVNLLDELDFAEFGDFHQNDRLFAWRELRAYLIFALSHFPNVVNRPTGDNISGNSRSLCFQWRQVGRLFTSVAVPNWFFGLDRNVPYALMRRWVTIISNDPFNTFLWNPACLPFVDPDRPYLFYEMPSGQTVQVTVLDSQVWIYPSRTSLSNQAISAIEQLSLSLSRSFSLRWSQLLYFYDDELQKLTFGTIRPFHSFEFIPLDVQTSIVEALVDTLNSRHCEHRAPSSPMNIRRNLPSVLITAAYRRSPAGGQIQQLTRQPTHDIDSLKSCRILLIASIEDPTAAYFYLFVIRKGIPIVFWPAEQISALTSSFTWNNASNVNFGIYYRRPGSNDAVLYQSLCLMDDLLNGVVGAVIGRSCNNSGSNHSKPLQTSLIAANSTELVRAVPTCIRSTVLLEQAEAVVVKALSAEKAEVVALSELLTDEGIYAIPTQLQQRLVGKNIRVHVCAGKSAAFEIRSPRLDYRFDPTFETHPVTLPLKVERWCIEMATREGLAFAGIDLLLKDGVYFCFEINPNPGYHIFEERLTKLGYKSTLSEWLIQYLTA